MVCVWTHAHILENHGQCEWTKIERSRNKFRNNNLFFPEIQCEKGLRAICLYFLIINASFCTVRLRQNTCLLLNLIFDELGSLCELQGGQRLSKAFGARMNVSNDVCLSISTQRVLITWTPVRHNPLIYKQSKNVLKAFVLWAGRSVWSLCSRYDGSFHWTHPPGPWSPDPNTSMTGLCCLPPKHTGVNGKRLLQ